ncbi:hypothetical protein J6590_008386 [Homalodisca vitripennis]|nr:hypothetical protein J6590_008386 [Homalodisca vitripennis]
MQQKSGPSSRRPVTLPGRGISDCVDRPVHNQLPSLSLLSDTRLFLKYIFVSNSHLLHRSTLRRADSTGPCSGKQFSSARNHFLVL